MRIRILRAGALSLAACVMAPGVAAADATGSGAAWELAPRAAPAELPPDAQARPLIDSQPRVVEARRGLEAARQRARMLAVGPNEWTALASAQRRRSRDAGPDTNDWSVGLERTLRIGGKAALDRQLGEAQLRLAQARLLEARHEVAQELLQLWLDWLGNERALQLWREQLGFAQANFDAADTRRRAGDASLLELNAARADLAEVQRRISGAANEEAKARARLRARFPLLPPVVSVAVTDHPASWGPADEQWRERILAESDVLRIAQEDLRRAELTARRAGADRLADPTVGVQATSEAGGAERIVGLTLRLPLGGTYRDAQLREALALVEVARAAVERSAREVESAIGETLADARGSLQRWQFAEQARAATHENARLTQRAYTLGEADLQALLLARRQLVDAALGAAEARTDLARARYRLLVDAHLIWGLNED